MMICDLDERGAAGDAADDIAALGVAVTAQACRCRRIPKRCARSPQLSTPRWRRWICLINNAGVAIGGGFLHTSLEDWNWIVSINVMGVVHGCHFFVPAMVARARGGHVVNIASAAGYLANAALAAYSTTKFAVVGLSEALQR